MNTPYSLRQLVRLSGMTAHTLRYYEKAGLLQQIGRDRNGYRVYEERDLAWLQLVHQLRTTGMPIRRLKQLADWRAEGSGTLADRRRMLEQHREDVRQHIEILQSSLAQIDRKVQLYQALEQHDQAGSGMSDDAAMKAYYAQRATYYEQIYERDDPVRQGELQAIEQAIGETLTGKRVLELACGTGFWTEKAAKLAARITATDATPETLDIARHKDMPADRVEFLQADAYEPDSIPGTFDGALAMFWFSHIPLARIPEFLRKLHQRIGSGSFVFMGDNMLVHGVGGELIRKMGEADTYKRRELSDGSTLEVLKNYFTEQQLRNWFTLDSIELQVHVGQCFWWVSYKVR